MALVKKTFQMVTIIKVSIFRVTLKEKVGTDGKLEFYMMVSFCRVIGKETEH